MKTNETTKTTTDATTEAKTFDQKMWEARNARRDSRRDEFVEADAIMDAALKAQRIKGAKGLPLQSKFGCEMIETARDAARAISEMIDELEKVQVAVLSAGTMHDTTRVPGYIRDINDVVRDVAKLKTLADTLRAAESFEKAV